MKNHILISIFEAIIFQKKEKKLISREKSREISRVKFHRFDVVISIISKQNHI